MLKLVLVDKDVYLFSLSHWLKLSAILIALEASSAAAVALRLAALAAVTSRPATVRGCAGPGARNARPASYSCN